MSKLSDINEVGRVSGTDEPKENPYEVKTEVNCLCKEDNPFSFENVSKMVGSINKVIYGIDPYAKQ